jgi:hypothetical protein
VDEVLAQNLVVAGRDDLCVQEGGAGLAEYLTARRMGDRLGAGLRRPERSPLR